MKSSKLITILLALMALTPMAWAQVLSGSGTTEDPYLINSGATVAFTNCLFHPSQVTIGTNGGQTFARWRSGNSSVIIGDNCYYSQIPATAQAHVGMTWLLGYEP